MLTLIRREIEDILVFYIIMLFAGFGFAGWLAFRYHSDDPWPMTAVPKGVLDLSVGYLIQFVAWAFIFEVAQRVIDQKERTSAFLSTLTATRRHLLMAKWTAALIWFGFGLLPMVVVHTYFLSRAMQWGQVAYVDRVIACLGLIVLAPTSCYLLSQFLACTLRPMTYLLVDLLISAAVFSVIIVKGAFSGGLQQVAMLLGILSVAAAFGTWSRFKSASL